MELEKISAYAALLYSASLDKAHITSFYGEFDIRHLRIGDFYFPTGKVATCDPFIIKDPEPFEQTIAPGHYPVVLSLAQIEKWGQRVAAATLIVNDKRPVNWTMAVTKGQNISELKEGYFYGYGVDAGTGCFIDLATAELLEHKIQDENYVDQLIDLMRRNDWKWANVILDEASGLNCAMFSSGLGDGAYASYWGYEEDGKVVCLITDFGLLITEE